MLGKALGRVKAEVEKFFAQHPDWFAAESPTLRLVTSLAEGADRIAARAAARLGYELTSPLPFLKEEFCRDFSPETSEYEDGRDSVAEFEGLLKASKWPAPPVVFEIEGDRDDPRVYTHSAQVVMNQSELLIAVWDGEPSAGAGGTAETVEKAMAHGIPVLWIDAHAPHTWQLLEGENELPFPSKTNRARPHQEETGDDFNCLAKLISKLLRPVREESSQKGKEKTSLREWYFREHKPWWNPFFLWKLFRDFFGEWRIRFQWLGVGDFEKAAMREWPDDEECRCSSWVNEKLRHHFIWPDRLADIFADAYRSGFVLSFSLAAMAVLFAVLPITIGAGHGHGEGTAGNFSFICHLVEAGCIGIILVTVGWSKCRRWHERWMEYRLIAELVRQRKILLPVGGGVPFPRRQPQHLARGYGQPSDTWMYGHVRAIDRAAGLPSAILDREYLREVLVQLRHFVSHQIGFHEAAHRRSRNIVKRFHGIGGCLLLLTLVAALAPVFWRHPPFDSNWFTICCAFFPAVGAAMAGILNQGEFSRIDKRSKAMASRLEELRKQIDHLLKQDGDSGAHAFSQVVQLSSEISQLLIDEVLDWRVVFKDRPPALPA